jgi:hypothetical protein
VLFNDVPLEDLLNLAIERRVFLIATYNRNSIRLAPHSLFERHGDPFLRAVTLEVDGRTPKEPKLGTFKLAGLSSVTLEGRAFSREKLFAGLVPAGAATGR